MIEPETVVFLESGCGILVGSVGPDGAPHASRGWGMTVLDPVDLRLLVVLESNDVVAAENLAPGRPIAITGAEVPTLRAMQLKGRSLGVEAATEADVERAARYADAFFGDIERADGDAREVLERILPLGYVVCTVAIDELYDQTPGPGAGARIGAAS